MALTIRDRILTAETDLRRWAGDQSRWYDEKKRWPKRFSVLLRLSSILLAGAGALCPLLASVEYFVGLGWDLNDWGYVLIAGGAGLFMFDQLLGFSATWMRHMTTHLKLEARLKRHDLAWTRWRTVTSDRADALTDGDVEAGFALLDSLADDVAAAVLAETEDWTADLKARLSAHEQAIKQQQKKERRGRD